MEEEFDFGTAEEAEDGYAGAIEGKILNRSQPKKGEIKPRRERRLGPRHGQIWRRV